MNPFFGKFPTMSYSNTVCLDLTKRIKLADELLSKPDVFYPYEVDPSMRSDDLAMAYYEDPTFDWLIYLTNGIVDPYYAWYMDDMTFERYIEKKYGSREAAYKQIMFWRVQWQEFSESPISPSFYENHLPYALKKYYQPELKDNGQIYQYKRKEDKWIVNTNQIVQFDLNYSTGKSFTKEEFIEIVFEGDTICNGHAVFSNSSTLFLKNSIGDPTANSTQVVTITGETSGSIATSNNSDIIQKVIPDDEFIYWGPVFAYEYEQEKNEANKLVTLLDARFAVDVADDLRRKLEGRL